MNAYKYSMSFIYYSFSLGASGAICGLFGLSMLLTYDRINEMNNKKSVFMMIGINLAMLILGSL